MANVKLLTTLKVFFKKIKIKWKSILIPSVILILLSGIIMAIGVETKTLFYKITITVFVLCVFSLVTLLVSFIIVPILDFKIRGARAWFNWSSSRLLPLGYRIKVASGLNELKNYTIDRFNQNQNTYIRIQLVSPFARFAHAPAYTREAFVAFPTPNCSTLPPCAVKFDNGSEEEYFTILINSKTYKNGKVDVAAKWISKENPSAQEISAAETVLLIKDNPTLLTYGFNRTNQNGESEAVDEVVLTITWIGGNV